MAKPDGGPFFPITIYDGKCQYTSAGATLRDAFAMAALQGILSNPTRGPNFTVESLVEIAWTYADSMLGKRGE